MSAFSFPFPTVTRLAWSLGLAALILLPGFSVAQETPASAPSRVPPLAPPPAGRQLIVAVAEDNNTDNGLIRWFTRTEKGWRADTDALECLFGKNGMAWGRGLHEPQEGLQKQE